MPSKHIDEKTWREIEKITVKAVIATNKPIKQGEILHFLIKRGMEDLTKDDFFELIKSK
jgi:hypothetical protein